MKITVDVDITPEELRKFFGLPNVEGLQEEMIKMAQQQMADSSQNFMNDMVTGAMQPMMAYQQWLGQMMSGGGTSRSDDSDKPAKAGKNK